MPWKKGQSGNPGGRKKDSGRDLLERAIQEAAGKRKKTLFQHAIERAYKDDTVLVAILRKLLPDLRSIDANIHAVPFRLILSNGHDSGATRGGSDADREQSGD